MPWGQFGNGDRFSDSESDDEYANSSYLDGGREGIIYVIDAFLSQSNEKFQECLDIIRKSLLNGLLIRNHDVIGIIICNTEHSPEPKDIDGIKNVVIKENTAILLPLRQLSKDIVQYYLEFSDADTDHFEFNNRYGIKSGNFTNLLWLCMNMFKQSSIKLSNSQILYFTNHDIPLDIENNTKNLTKTMKIAQDLNELDIDFCVIPMMTDDTNFNYEKFYKEFMCTVQNIELDEFQIMRSEILKEFIIERRLKQNFKKQCISHLKWKLNDDNNMEISVAMYSCYRKNIYPKRVTLLRTDNSIIEVKRVHKLPTIDDGDDDGAVGNYSNAAVLKDRICKPGDEKKFIKIGGEKITFTNDELTKMRYPLHPCITLLGFKSHHIITINNFLRSSSFLYPDENVIEGSTKLFRTIWEKCIEKQKTAICLLISRRKSIPRYVALVPVSSMSSSSSASASETAVVVDDDDDDYIKKDGFKIVYLPFEIDYREIDLSDRMEQDVHANDEQIVLFQNIIKKLKFKSNLLKIRDQSLEKLQKDLIGLALDIETGETEPIIDVSKQDERLKPLLADFEKLFIDNQEDGKKRRPNDEQQQRSNKQKIPRTNTSEDNDRDDSVSQEKILQLIRDKKLNALTAKQLRSYLQSKNVKGISSATKPVLIDKILELHL